MAVPQTEKAHRLQVSVHIQAEVLSAEAVRREANYWLLENVGNLLRADNPELVLGEQLIWRIGIVLTSPTHGQIGVVGRIELDAITGEVLADETLAEELTPCPRPHCQLQLSIIPRKKMSAVWWYASKWCWPI